MFVVEIHAVSHPILSRVGSRWKSPGRPIIIVCFIRMQCFVKKFKYALINILPWGKLKGEEMSCSKIKTHVNKPRNKDQPP